MQQILVIHGGTSFDTHEDYLAFIKNRELTIEKLSQGLDWRASLAGDLGNGFEVLSPKMPNGTNARYEEWKMWFERCAEMIDDQVILIGQSLGGIFLAKYLAENYFPRKIKATLIVAAPYDDVSTVESLKDFALPSSLAKCVDQGGAIHLMYSQDDPVVPFSELAKYRTALPMAVGHVFSDKGHFDQPHFPELVALMQSLIR